jgi:GNAT superfamily N-acetyltransferase
MNNITIREVKTRSDLREFIYLPSRVHSHNRNWLPPLYSDEWILYDPAKNRSFEYCDHIRLLAIRDGKCVGRIMGLINHRYNGIKNENNARFCFLESFNDPEIVKSLLLRIEEWAKEKNAGAVKGPLAFSDKDPQGLQTEGFEMGAVLSSPTNASFLPVLVESSGYSPDIELVDYLADIPSQLPEMYSRVLERINGRNGIEILEFRTKREMKPWIPDILQVMNDTYGHIYGFVPLTEKEMGELAARFMPLLDPRFIKAIRINGIMASFVIAMPDIADGLRKAKGKLWPAGFIHILRSAKRGTRLLMLLGAIREEYRGKGLDAIMASKILESARKSNMQTLDSHLILSHNTRMRAEYERLGGKVIRRYTIYSKQL